MRLLPFQSRSLKGEPSDVAADLVMREEDGQLGPEGLAARDAWLAEHPDHVAAYDATVRAMERLDGHAADPRILALRDAALSAKAERQSSPWRVAAAVAVGVVLLGAGLAAVSRDRPVSLALAQLDQLINPNASVYRTAVGERSTITLPDGSVATLNTDTVLKVAFTDTARGVRLVRGQALFEVAHNKSRPFEVYAGDRTITALGTVFDVRIDGDGVKVALVEGRVRVRPRAPRPAGAAPAPQVVMAAGEVLEAQRAQPMVVRNLDVMRETSWRSGVVVFDETPLSEAVAELNRYSHERLLIDDPSIAGLHVTGSSRPAT